MKKIFTLFVILFPLLSYAQQPCKELFISEYVDGTNKNKVVELYNPSDSIIDLTNYHIRIFQNGSPTPQIIPLQGSINPKETFVVTHPQADATLLTKANQTDVKMNFDGNDAVVLRKGISTDIDKIGEIGVNPGSSGWTVSPSGSTKDNDLRRKFPIDRGETDWNHGKNQWTILPKDSLQDIKFHDNTCSHQTPPSCTELFISEYLDGNFMDKAIEIFNPTDSIINLINYSLKVFQNGAPTPLDIPLSGNINPKEAYVITHPQANSTLLVKSNQTHVNLNFDGNDAIILNKDVSTYIDKIGEVAVNPGNNGWTIPPSGTTKDIDLRRKFPIDKGEGDWNSGKNQWDIFPKDSIQNIKEHQNACTAAYAEVNFKFDNPSVLDSSNGSKYFLFDILISITPNSDPAYFRFAPFYIGYDTTAFGDSLAPPDVSVIKGQNFSASYNNPTVGFTSDSVFKIFYGASSNPNNTLLTTIWQQLMRVKIKIKNCSNKSNIHFTDIATTALLVQYTLTPTDAGQQLFDQALYLNSLDVNIPCDSNASILFISDFNPKTIPAGINSILTITGSGFGATRGDTGQVAFKNADNGGASYIRHLDYIDYDFWSDSLIRVIIPSVVDTLDSLNNNNKKSPIGSGKFYVKNNSGDSVIINSIDTLTVTYARANTILPFNTSPPQAKYKRYLATTELSDSSTIIFYLDTSITNYPIKTAVIKKTIKDWRCRTGVNFTVNDTGIYNQNYFADGFSVIHIDKNIHGSPFAAETQPYRIGCNGNIIVPEIDIRISIDFSALTQFNPIPQWTYDTTSSSVPVDSVDFYGTILHEIGHAHQLLHVNDKKDVMYYGRSPGPIPVIGRVSIEPLAQYNSPNAHDGAVEVNNESKLINFNPATCPGTQAIFIPSDQSKCIDVDTKVKTIIKNNYNFLLFPVPTTEILNISYNLTSGNFTQIKLLNIQGNEIVVINNSFQSTGNYQYQVNLANATQGLYFLVANINGTILINKIIKL